MRELKYSKHLRERLSERKKLGREFQEFTRRMISTSGSRYARNSPTRYTRKPRVRKRPNPRPVLTLKQVAEACEVTSSHISQIEKSKRPMSTEVLKELAEVLKVDVELL